MVFTLKKQLVCARYLLKGQWMLNCPSLHQSTVRLTSTDLQLCVNVSSLITAALRSLRGVCSESAGVCRRAVSALWSFPSWERAWERSTWCDPRLAVPSCQVILRHLSPDWQCPGSAIRSHLSSVRAFVVDNNGSIWLILL